MGTWVLRVHTQGTDLLVTNRHNSTPWNRQFVLGLTIVQGCVKPMINQLLNMHNGNLWSQAPGPCPREAQTLDGLNKLLELQKCNQSPGLCPSLSQGYKPIPEKFLMHGVDVYPSLSSLPVLMSHLTQDYLWGLGRKGIPPPSNIVPHWSHPGPQAPRVGSRHRAGLTVVGPLYPSRLSRSNKHTGRGGVVYLALSTVLIQTLGHRSHTSLKRTVGRGLGPARA